MGDSTKKDPIKFTFTGDHPWAELKKYQDDAEKLFEKVKTHMGWTGEKTSAWFSIENPLLGGLTPSEFYKTRPEKCIAAIETLIEEGKFK